ncbi:type II/III secretion system protein [Legionella maioricensis]|uniref:Type II/III secretion system protein n=1 Tax=Legionella maioricensis TaxID=2896528 RepID=A0A9X2D2F8_9GAMM|nr:type II/III secretion system protein [Legionella maioricensis]MCL9685420.1 type II/III secretion system protein [Legionella maioricensis]MCL9688722.1 type II/III secretion system protein [Legionella maioricensis]
MKQWWIGLLLLIASNAFSQSLMTKVIELNYLPANKVIELIQPLLQSGEKVSGSGQTLIVKVAPETLTQIRTILHQVDVPPVTFNISIYQGDPNWLSPQNSNSVSYSTQPRSEQVRSQSVKVMSGESAFISTGEEVPIITSVGTDFYTGASISYEQRNIRNGLLVSPVLKGSQVKLKLKRIREQVNAAGGQQFDNQNLNTTIMAPLNKWVSLGSAEGGQQADSSSRSYSAGRTYSQSSTLYIKVSIINAMPSGATK